MRELKRLGQWPSRSLRMCCSSDFGEDYPFAEGNPAQEIELEDEEEESIASVRDAGVVEVIVAEPVPSGVGRSATKPLKTSRKIQKVFIVHGHDKPLSDEVAKFLSSLNLDPIILHEKANKGRTIIEKFEAHAGEAAAAVVLLTPDDKGGKQSAARMKSRSRQNVVFEFGYFAGKIGRKRAIALYAKGVELPSDLNGLVYIELAKDWKLELKRELKSAGLKVKANKLFPK
jgi:predicted nucleotide-binding protein